MSKKADIFIQSKHSEAHTHSYKPLRNIKISGIIIMSAAALLCTAVFFAPQPHQTDNLDATTIPSGYVMSTNNNVPDNRNYHYNYHNTVIQPRTQLTYPSPVTYYPNNNTNCSNSYNCNSYPNNYGSYISYNTSSPTITPVPTIMPVNQPNEGNIASITSQLIAIQQQIGGQMQTCVNNAQQMANQIIALMNQQKQLQAQIDALNNQASNIDTSMPAGQSQQNEINQRTQQLQQQSDNLGTAISNAQNNMSTANSQCQQNVSNLEQNRGQLESNLDDAFNNTMNIQLPND